MNTGEWAPEGFSTWPLWCSSQNEFTKEWSNSVVYCKYDRCVENEANLCIYRGDQRRLILNKDICFLFRAQLYLYPKIFPYLKDLSISYQDMEFLLFADLPTRARTSFSIPDSAQKTLVLPRAPSSHSEYSRMVQYTSTLCQGPSSLTLQLRCSVPRHIALDLSCPVRDNSDRKLTRRQLGYSGARTTIS